MRLLLPKFDHIEVSVVSLTSSSFVEFVRSLAALVRVALLVSRATLAGAGPPCWRGPGGLVGHHR